MLNRVLHVITNDTTLDFVHGGLCGNELEGEELKGDNGGVVVEGISEVIEVGIVDTDWGELGGDVEEEVEPTEKGEKKVSMEIRLLQIKTRTSWGSPTNPAWDCI